jgi:alkylhydroperoxidase/carboxymuconolactone decarboxylase family protein YurZ
MIANKQVPMAMNQHATTEKLLEAVFFVVHTVAAAMQWHGKHIYVATNRDVTTEVLLETVFSTRSVQRVYMWSVQK